MRRRRGPRPTSRLGSTVWVDRLGRLEAADLVNAHRHHAIAYHGARPRQRFDARIIMVALSLLLALIPIYGDMKRRGWLPDLEPGLPFPQSGSVTVSEQARHRRLTSRLTIAAGPANAVVQLYEPQSGAHLLSIYVGKREQIEVPVPAGTFNLRFVEGQKWHGTTRYFGPNTAFTTAADPMTFSPKLRQIIELQRRPDGNLRTREMLGGPERLVTRPDG
jgi:hypothetical protein